MKYLFLIGGSLGFALVFLGGWIVGREPLSSVIQASFGCLVGAVLFRWLGNTYARSVRTVLLEREAASRARPAAGDSEAASSTQS
jgi:hypothetical protein